MASSFIRVGRRPSRRLDRIGVFSTFGLKKELIYISILNFLFLRLDTIRAPHQREMARLATQFHCAVQVKAQRSPRKLRNYGAWSLSHCIDLTVDDEELRKGIASTAKNLERKLIWSAT